MFGIIVEKAAGWDISFFEFGFEGGWIESGGVEGFLLEEEEKFFVVGFVAIVTGFALVVVFVVAVDVTVGEELNHVLNVHGGWIDGG